jgi:hypothetical protein
VENVEREEKGGRKKWEKNRTLKKQGCGTRQNAMLDI